MRIVSAALCLGFVLSVVVSCTREKSFEVGAPAVGSLKNDGSGDCLPKTAAGSFIAGTALSADSNYLEVEVDVAREGSYTIRTDTLNGYSFTGTGNFTKTGINRIRLAGSGTPVDAGENAFTVIFDTSFCFVPVTVLPAGSASGPAAFTLQGSGDTCMLSSVSGTYVQNVALNAANTVDIKVNATAIGTYTVTTDTVNEFSFAGSGTISAPGSQTITLKASGTPATEGATVFTVSAGGTTCTFTVNVTTSNTPPVATGDHFPLMANSYWTYADDESGDPEDSTVVTNRGLVNIPDLPNPYYFFEIADGGRQAFDTAVYRKSGDDYYTYIPVDQYTLVTFDQEQRGDILFLKENLKTGDIWTSTEFSGTQGNKPVKIRYSFQCMDANATFPQNSVTFTNVYKIKCKPETSINGASFLNAGEEIDFYYAKGVGLIYQKGSVNGATAFETSILHYKVY